MLSVGTIFRIFGSAFALVGLLLVYHRYDSRQFETAPEKKKTRKKSSNEDGSRDNRQAYTNLSFTRQFERTKPDISTEELEKLVSLLPSANATKFLKIMTTLIQLSNNNANMPSFDSPKILESLFSHLSLGDDGEFLREVNVHVLNLFTNLFVDDYIRGFLKDKIDRFFGINLSLITEAESVALLRLLGNCAIMDDCSPNVAKHFSEIFEFVSSKSDAVRCQAWTVLLNCSHSCESKAIIFQTEAIEEFATVLMAAFHEKDVSIQQKSVAFIYRLYDELKRINISQYKPGTLLFKLIQLHDDLRKRNEEFLSQSGGREDVLEVAKGLERLLQHPLWIPLLY